MVNSTFVGGLMIILAIKSIKNSFLLFEIIIQFFLLFFIKYSPKKIFGIKILEYLIFNIGLSLIKL